MPAPESRQMTVNSHTAVASLGGIDSGMVIRKLKPARRIRKQGSEQTHHPVEAAHQNSRFS